MAGVEKRIIILDSNCYFRLANTFHPLLATEFGEPLISLRITKYLEQEYLRSSRLKSKFYWVSQEKYIEDRSNCLHFRGKRRKNAEMVFDYMSKHADYNGIDVSRIDIWMLAYGNVLFASVVTDDVNMRKLAEGFSIDTLSTLELLHLMNVSRVRA